MILEILVSLAIVGILILFLNPTQLLMPESVNTMLMLALILIFLLFAALIWKEKAVDERDNLHIQKAGRLSFLVGIGILVSGVVVQARTHNIDPWLLLALSGMVLTKLVSRIYHHFKN